MFFFLVSGSERYSLVVGSLLIVVALAGERGGASSSFSALELRLKGYGAWAQLLSCVWNLSGIKPVSPAFAGGFFTTKPPGKPKERILKAAGEKWLIMYETKKRVLLSI